ncbi:hypothetical protein SAMN05421721_10612 [Ectothiorhodospira mobilis]|uniref:PepSY domain-containing protein n=1 Tax=Ectothiorhodospira mobilis TaxID=195064 RepID=A0A1I4QZG5_ECTMO|nr:hypothetical protein SAMN05421721_10612 [Ectothiorhodospira mobilis]
MLCLLLCLCLWAGAVPAQPVPGPHLAQAGSPQGAEVAPVTLDEAVAQVQARTGGRVLSAETLEEEGQRVHRIRVLLQDQRVRDIRVDAATGQWQ